MELKALELLSHCKTKDELKRKIKKYKWKKESVSINEDEKGKRDFWTLIKEFYNKIIEIIYIEEYTKENIRNDIDDWNSRAQGYFMCKETYDAKYIPWNFEDIKMEIDEISTNSLFRDQKEIMQDLTAGVISLRDTYEMYAWWSNEDL